jgi:hypothetical protein
MGAELLIEQAFQWDGMDLVELDTVGAHSGRSPSVSPAYRRREQFCSDLCAARESSGSQPASDFEAHQGEQAMSIKVAINGYGRIGRNILRAHYEGRHKHRHDLAIVAINDLGSPRPASDALRHDARKIPRTYRGGWRRDGGQRRP